MKTATQKSLKKSRAKNMQALELGVLEELFNGNAVAKILDFVTCMQEYDYSESDLARYSGVSIKTAQVNIPKLVRFGLLVHTRTSGRAKMYKMSKDTKTGDYLYKWGLLLAKVRIDGTLAKDLADENNKR